MEDYEVVQITDRNIYLYGEINDSTASSIVSHINQVNEIDNLEEEILIDDLSHLIAEGVIKEDSLGKLNGREPITIEINSHGGSTPAGFSIITAIQNSITPVIGYVTGNCMSMAIPILTSCDYRIASEYSNFMIHDIYSASEGKFNDLNSSLEYINSVRNDYIKATAKHTEMSEEEVKEITNKNSDYFFSPDKALELGIIDHIDDREINEEEVLDKIYGIEETKGEEEEDLPRVDETSLKDCSASTISIHEHPVIENPHNVNSWHIDLEEDVEKGGFLSKFIDSFKSK